LTPSNALSRRRQLPEQDGYRQRLLVIAVLNLNRHKLEEPVRGSSAIPTYLGSDLREVTLSWAGVTA